MTTATVHATPAHRGNWLTRAEAWLDDRGKGAWIAATPNGVMLLPSELKSRT